MSSEAHSLVAESTLAEGTETEGSNILIAYFTYGENAELPDDVDASSSASIQIFNGEVTGNTGVMAHMIAEASGGELFSIRTVEPYPNNYNDTVDVGESEKNNGIRPSCLRISRIWISTIPFLWGSPTGGMECPWSCTAFLTSMISAEKR